MFSSKISSYIKEFIFFVTKNAQATVFGFFIVILIFLTKYISLFDIHSYDLIFLAVVCFQVFLIFSKRESLKEFRVIILFHIVATIMELFKTSKAIGSWSYPMVESAFFVIATVPLFTGFLYSAVGSYISRSIQIFDMKFYEYPSKINSGLLALLIYINFFTHHFFYDMRYILFLGIVILFGKTKIYFTITERVRSIPFILAGFLAAFFVWLVENFSSYMGVWLYPNQVNTWQMVSVQKIGSWFLLLVVSFVLISLIHRDRLMQIER